MAYINLALNETGQSLYAVFYHADRGWIWDNASQLFRDTTAATGSGNGKLNYATQWANVAISLMEDQGSSSNPTAQYQIQVPQAVLNAASAVDVVIREISSPGSPARTDAIVAQGTHVTSSRNRAPSSTS